MKTATLAPVQATWDVIVVGAGMGGGTIAYALAKGGKRVLILEKGRARPALRGDYAETRLGSKPTASEARSVFADAGRCWQEIEDRSEKRPTRFVPFIGAGAGGSSALYGMVLERFHPDDFKPRGRHPEVPEADLPESWPFAYADLAPYYDQAEQLYRVRGERDPLRGEPLPALDSPVRGLAANQQDLHDYLLARGLHPYRLPVACEEILGCQSCQGYLCARECKNDSARVCLEPALREHGAAILDECTVTGLRASSERVTGVFCTHRGESIELHAETIVLAAGALYTPEILLRSVQDGWPAGLANRSGLVGCNLMRHCLDVYLVQVGRAGSNREKALGFNDFYHDAGGRLGTVQSFGALPPAAILVYDLCSSMSPLAATLVAPFRPLLRTVLHRLTQRLTLATVLEDLPYRGNRVMLDGREIAIEYRLGPYERTRIARSRRAMQSALAGLSPRLLKQAENNQRLAHACGTCRAGQRAADSVVDAHCRAHDLENLYIVDASFFPSSTGTNPALTIAANALRVADHLLAKSPSAMAGMPFAKEPRQ